MRKWILFAFLCFVFLLFVPAVQRPFIYAQFSSGVVDCHSLKPKKYSGDTQLSCFAAFLQDHFWRDGPIKLWKNIP